VGLLELDLPREPTPEVIAEARRTAHVLGYVVIASRRPKRSATTPSTTAWDVTSCTCR
jgi:hypothetical protein